MADPLAVVRGAVSRGLDLLAVLNREHDSEELHGAARAVRHELLTATEALAALEAQDGEPAEDWVEARAVADARAEHLRRALATRPGSGRHRVLSAVLDQDRRGATDAELVTRLAGAMSPPSVLARRWELKAAGWVVPLVDAAPVPVAQKRDGHTVWVVTGDGWQAHRKLQSGQLAFAFTVGELPEPAGDELTPT